MFTPSQAFVTTRAALHRVAVHIVARARDQATGRFSLRAAPGGFGTPDFGPEGRRVRVDNGLLIVESDAPGKAMARSVAIDGLSLRSLADEAGVDLGTPLDVGHDTPPLGDVDALIAIDSDAAAVFGEWSALALGALDRVVAELPSATMPRLWPEHFDIAIETDARGDRRVNLGASPGDAFSPEPYLYVGPWTPDRPGDPAFWNAPFGAVLAASELGPDRATQREVAATFLLDGLARLR